MRSKVETLLAWLVGVAQSQQPFIFTCLDGRIITRSIETKNKYQYVAYLDGKVTKNYKPTLLKHNPPVPNGDADSCPHFVLSSMDAPGPIRTHKYQLRKEILRDTAASKMDDVRDSQNVIEIIGEDGPRNGADNWDDQAVWAAENEYLGWDEAAYVDTTSNLIHDGRQTQPRSGSEQPNKRTRNVEESVLATSPAMVFFKTKLCCRFRLGTCPNFSNCNFAHSIDELRCVPQNRKEIMAAREKERAASADPMEEFQILFPGSSSFTAETQRSYKNRHCKKFYTEEGCPYGDSCIYFHDEQAKDRERVAIILGPGSGVDGAATGNGGGGPVAAPTEGLAVAPAISNTAPRPSNWKTRICRKWELTAFCPYGSKCIFAHGAAELHAYGGGLVAPEANPNRQGLMPLTVVATPGLSAARADGSERVPGRMRRLDKLSKINHIYGDWIDDLQ